MTLAGCLTATSELDSLKAAAEQGDAGAQGEETAKENLEIITEKCRLLV